MIIIEGPDLVGKTTLCRKLEEKCVQLKYNHLSRPTDDFHRYWSYLPYIKPSNLMDRFYISEPVYTEVRGDVHCMDPGWAVPLDREVISAGGVTVILTADTELIANRYEELVTQASDGGLQRAEMYNLNQIAMANVGFFNVASGTHPTHNFHVDLHFHFTVNRPWIGDKEIEKILYYHQCALNRAAYLKATREFPIPTKV